MEKETSCINSRAILDYLKAHDCDYTGMLKGLDPEIDVLEDPESFLRDPNNWISSRAVTRLFEMAIQILGDDQAAYKIGRYVTENNGLGFFQRIVIKSFWSIKTGLRHVQKMNDIWNRSKKVELIELKRNKATIRLHWDPEMETSKHICQYNQAVYTFLPLVWGGSRITLKEKCCYFNNAPFCEYHLKWPLRNRFKEILSRFFSSKSVIADTVKEIEKDKKIIEQKNTELRAINKELNRRMVKIEQAEEALLNSKERLKKFMDSATDGFILFDSELNILEINKSALEIIGFEWKKVVGKNLSDIVPNIKKTSIYAKFNKVLKTGLPFHIPDIVSFPEFNNKHIDLKVFKVGNGLGIIFTDITDRKNLEAHLQQAQKMESIGTLAGGIAHDFNNILSPIMMHSEMVMDDLEPDNPLRHDIREIYKASERARDLVKQILTFASKNPEEKVVLKSSLIVKEAIKFLRSTIPTTIDIQLNLKGAKDTILANPTQLNQIVMNLCTNAAYAMKENGGLLEVTLDDEVVEKGDVYTGLKPGQYLKISVRDTGTGMPPEVIEKIFEPYYTTKGIGKGTGLGLAIIHGIINRYGGDITVDSEVSRGTTFNVYLPLVNSKNPDTDLQEEEIQKGNERILFVDDEQSTVDVNKKMLERLGYDVSAWTSSIKALEIFRNNPEAFDLVITDMTMPDMTGKEFAGKLKESCPDIPIILCTGFSDQIDEESAREIGVDYLKIKPITRNEIAKTIRELMDK
jgi:signal transduction histidine kinase/ActR/RegA family two-component response regulator